MAPLAVGRVNSPWVLVTARWLVPRTRTSAPGRGAPAALVTLPTASGAMVLVAGGRS